MRPRSPIIALFLLAVFGLGGIGAPMVHKVMHERAIAPLNDVELPGVISHAEHPEADAARHAHPESMTWTCSLCALFATLVLGDVSSSSLAAYIGLTLLPSSLTHRTIPFFQPFPSPARAPPHLC